MIDGIRLEGSVQLYLPEQNGDDGDASMIRAELTSNTTVDAREDGTAEVMTIG